MRYWSLLIALVSALAFAQPLPQNPKPGPVPDEAAAIAIAVAVLKPIYGSDRIDLQRPFVATLENGQWHVEGSAPPGAKGKAAEIWIAKDDGRVVKVSRDR